MCVLSHSVMSDSLRPHGPGSSVHRDSPGKNTRVGCRALLQGIFSTQGWNPGLLHCRQILCHLSHQGSLATPILYPRKGNQHKDLYKAGSLLLLFTHSIVSAGSSILCACSKTGPSSWPKSPSTLHKAIRMIAAQQWNPAWPK